MYIYEFKDSTLTKSFHYQVLANTYEEARAMIKQVVHNTEDNIDKYYFIGVITEPTISSVIKQEGYDNTWVNVAPPKVMPPKRIDEPATRKQIAYIKSIAEELGYSFDIYNSTKAEAREYISKHIDEFKTRKNKPKTQHKPPFPPSELDYDEDRLALEIEEDYY